jgi:hypothetical protein
MEEHSLRWNLLVVKVNVLPIKLLYFYLFRYEEDESIGDDN